MSSGFISETEAAEVRKRRQEEWERVRKPSDPIERPEDPFDNRSLYDRLREQKQKKDLEYEEAHKLKNMIKGLDDDEIEFLELVDRTKLAVDKKKEIEEEQELKDYRNRVAILQEKSIDERLQSEIVVTKSKMSTTKLNQQKLLKGVVVKKSECVKRKITSVSEDNGESSTGNDDQAELRLKRAKPSGNSEAGISSPVGEEVQIVNPSALECVAVLPGLGCYNDSSSEDASSNSDDSEVESKQFDLLGRKIVKIEKEAVQSSAQK